MNNKKLFSLGDLSGYHIIPFLIAIFHMATTYVERDIIIENKKTHEVEDEEEVYKQYQLPFFIINLFSKLFSGIFYMINKFILNKYELSSKFIPSRLLRRYHINVKSKKKLTILLFYIMIISALEVFFMIEDLRALRKNGLIEIKLGFTIFVPIFTYIILKTKYYRHHFVSIIVGLVGFLFIILSLFAQNYDENPSFKDHLIHILYSIPFSLSLVLTKYLFINFFISSFSFLFLNGIFSLIFSFLYILLENLFLEQSDLFLTNLKNILFVFKNWKIFSLLICILICTFGYYLSSVVTLYLFTPTLFVMIDILSPILIWIISNIVNIIANNNEFNVKESIFKFIGYIFLLISCIIFNEIIICNFCQMNYNTIQQIEERGIEDVKESSNNRISNDSVFLQTIGDIGKIVN